MDKKVQESINDIVLTAYKAYADELCTACTANSNFNAKRLFKCSAVVFETEHFYVLQSYYTVIALIDKDTDTLFDFLRYVYGYTATSAQHIRKFEKAYCKGMWGCHSVYTYRGL
jgi:hypothetical protein